MRTAAASPFVVTPRLENSTWYLGNRVTGLGQTPEFCIAEALLHSRHAPPAHVHTREDELFYVLEGEASFAAGGGELTGGPGTFAYLPKGVPHAFTILSPTARVISILLPSGFEAFFNAFSEPAKDFGLGPVPESVDVRALIEKGAELGAQFVPPGIAIKDAPTAFPNTLQPVLLGRGAGESYHVAGSQVTVKLGGAACTVAETLDPTGVGAALHGHREVDESFVVLSGEYELNLAGDVIPMSPGDFAHLPAGTPHGYRNVASEPGRLLVFATPGGLEGYYRDMDALMTSGRMDFAGVVQVGAKHGIAMLPAG